LVITLWVIVIVATIALTYTFQSRTEVWMARYAYDSARARYAAKAGAARAMILLREDVLKDNDVLERSNLIKIDDDDKGYKYDGPNEEWFNGGEKGYKDVVLETDVAGERWAAGSYSVRVIDEASKLNLNHGANTQEVYQGLLHAIGIEERDEEFAQALAALIIDWRDTDDRPSDAGDERDWGEADSEDTFWNPHIDAKDIEEEMIADYFVCKNGPFGSPDEVLLLIQHLETLELIDPGMAPIIYFGEDANHNGELDDGERDGNDSYPPDDGDDVLLLGLRDYLTVQSPGPVNVNTASQVVIEAILRALMDEREARTLAERIVEHRDGSDRDPGTSDDRVMRTPDGSDDDRSIASVRGLEEFFGSLRPFITIYSDVFTIVSTGRYPVAEERGYRRWDVRAREEENAKAVHSTVRVTVFREFVEKLLLDRETEYRGGHEVSEDETLGDPRDNDPARIYVIRYDEEAGI
jgi:type II secretory pathway component PulK